MMQCATKVVVSQGSIIEDDNFGQSRNRSPTVRKGLLIVRRDHHEQAFRRLSVIPVHCALPLVGLRRSLHLAIWLRYDQ